MDFFWNLVDQHGPAIQGFIAESQEQFGHTYSAIEGLTAEAQNHAGNIHGALEGLVKQHEPALRWLMDEIIKHGSQTQIILEDLAQQHEPAIRGLLAEAAKHGTQAHAKLDELVQEMAVAIPKLMVEATRQGHEMQCQIAGFVQQHSQGSNTDVQVAPMNAQEFSGLETSRQLEYVGRIVASLNVDKLVNIIGRCSDGVKHSVISVWEKHGKNLSAKSVRDMFLAGFEFFHDNPQHCAGALLLCMAVTSPFLLGSLLALIGFTSIGPATGSAAALFQSAFGTPFAFRVLQSAAMGGCGILLIGIPALAMSVGAGATGVALLSLHGTDVSCKRLEDNGTKESSDKED